MQVKLNQTKLISLKDKFTQVEFEYLSMFFPEIGNLISESPLSSDWCLVEYKIYPHVVIYTTLKKNI